MIDLVRLQEFLFHAVLSHAPLERVNVVQWRKLRLESEIALDTIYLTPRAGRSGAGILVEMPEFDTQHENLSGPKGLMRLSFAILEEPNLNFNPVTGTLLSCEEIAQHIARLMHHFPIGEMGISYAAPATIREANEYPNVLAYRATFIFNNPNRPWPRVATPAITEAAGEVTLTCATTGARIFYTLDRSFPGVSNPAATEYAAPFAVTAGDEVYFAAFAADYVQSAVQHATITT